MPPRLWARTSLIAEVATIRGFAPAALNGRPPPRNATPVDPLRKGYPTCPRMRRRIDRCLMRPAREPPTSATGPSQTAALYQMQGGVISSAITLRRQPLSLFLAATCRSPSDGSSHESSHN
jgi:hypothetical protein